MVATRLTPAYSPTLGQSIGPYRITGVLGEGGMGVVYAAEQTAPIRRRVAVKVVRADQDSAEVVTRFEAERQALAVMEHPNIAKVFDAGATDTGRPYFVMEYVDGVPLGDYCDARRLPVAQRLTLFIAVCHAVQHAHLKGVIHRDLKPSNVLVVEEDGVAVPKVIDFGIAKAAGGRLTDRTHVTSLGLVLGTPAYMSPEQAEGAGVDVDTRSDVYALGVILYELLTGTLPADPSKVGLVPFIGMLMARLVSTPAPSARVTEGHADTGAAAAARGVDPAGLARELRGDLDAIVLKAVAPERERRYQSARELAADVERHLAHRPIAARAPSVGYRLGKLARRHPTRVALAASAALFLVGLTAVSAVQARRVERARAVAERRRTQAEELIGYMVGDLRGRLQPIGRLELLDDVAERALAYFAAVPAAELTAEELFRRSQALAQLGQVRMDQGNLDEAMRAFRASLSQAQDLAARDVANADWQVQLGAGHFYVGYVHYLRGHLDSALAQFAPYLDISRRLVARDSTNAGWQMELAYAYSNIGSVREAQGDLDQALDAFRRTLAIKARQAAADNTNPVLLLDVGHTHNTVGRAFERVGELDSARHHYATELSIKRRVAATDTANALWQSAVVPALTSAAGIDELRGALASARPLYASAHRIASVLHMRDSANTDWARAHAATGHRLGRVDLLLGQRSRGVEMLEPARRALRTLLSRDSTNADVRMLLATVERDLASGLVTADPRRARALVDGAEALLAPLAARPVAQRRVGVELARTRLLRADLDERGGDGAGAWAARLAALDALGAPRERDELPAVAARAAALARLGRRADVEPLHAVLRRAGIAPTDPSEVTARVTAKPQ